MNLIKLQPIYFDSHLWSDDEAYKVLSAPDTETPPFYLWDGNKDEWLPFTKYGLNSAVRRGQHVYYSVKDDNEDDPYFNYVGLDLSTSPYYTNSAWLFGKGNESWIRGRSLHDFDCINYVSPGATQRRNYLELQFKPQSMGTAHEVAAFYNNSELKYLILMGVMAESVVIEFYAGASLLDTITVESSENITTQKRITRDTQASCFLHPDLPSVLKDTILVPYSQAYDKIIVKLTAGDTGINAKIKHIFIGSSYQIGVTEGSSLSLGGIDYSRINYDDWGKMSLIGGRRAKTMKATVHLIKQYAQYEEKIIRLLQSCRATPTLFFATNKALNTSLLGQKVYENKFISSLLFTFGLVKNVAVDETNTNHRILDLQIDGIPIDYNP